MEVFRKTTPKIKEKKRPGRESPFTVEFMSMVARQVLDEGITYREAAKTYQISQGAVASWIKKFKKGDFLTPDRRPIKAVLENKVHLLEDNVKELKREIGELYLENLMLKKALSYSVSSKKENSSVITSENLDQFQKAAK